MHALDAVRGGALLLLGVAYHATMAYLSKPVAPVQDEASLPRCVVRGATRRQGSRQSQRQPQVRLTLSPSPFGRGQG